MLSYIYKKLVIDFSKLTFLLIAGTIIFSLYHAKNFNLDASSDALLLEGDNDLKYLREINDRYGSKDFLVLTYEPVSSFTEKETILDIQLLKSKIEKLTWVDIVITLIDVPLLKSTDENLMERLKNYKTYDELKAKLNRVLGLDGAAPSTTAESNFDAEPPAEIPSAPAAAQPELASDDDESLDFFKKLAED